MRKVVLLLGFLFITNLVHAEGFTLSSPDINGQLSNKEVFSGFGCSGKNTSPALNWKTPPKGTESFAITMYDPDAPTGSGWWHWIIFNIPSNINSLKSGAGDNATSIAPKGSVQSTTSYGQPGFGGACPPQEAPAHQYVFTIYALKVKELGLKPDATPALVGYYLNQHTLAKSSLIAYYSRK